MNKNRYRCAAVFASLLWPLVAGAQNNEANISTGNAPGSGVVQTFVTLQKTINGITFTQEVKWNTQIEAGDDANTKAGKIRSSAPTNLPEMENISGTSNTVGAQGKNGWTITSMVFSKDPTKEKHTHNVFSTFAFTDHIGVFSLTDDSFATGLDSFGGPGFIKVDFFGESIRVDTFPGMNGADLEGLVNIEIVALQLESSIESLGSPTMDKFDVFSGAGHDDQMLFIYDIDELGLTIEVADTGIGFDVSGLFVPSPGAMVLLGLSGLTVVQRRRSPSQYTA